MFRILIRLFGILMMLPLVAVAGAQYLGEADRARLGALAERAVAVASFGRVTLDLDPKGGAGALPGGPRMVLMPPAPVASAPVAPAGNTAVAGDPAIAPAPGPSPATAPAPGADLPAMQRIGASIMAILGGGAGAQADAETAGPRVMPRPGGAEAGADGACVSGGAVDMQCQFEAATRAMEAPGAGTGAGTTTPPAFSQRNPGPRWIRVGD